MSESGSDSAVDLRRELWRRGSYEIVGDWIAPASIGVLDAVERAIGGSLGGRRLLDVATGTGTVAIEGARRGADVTGVDLTDELLEVARRRACSAELEVRWLAGDFDHLDEALLAGPFGVITSAFGVMFAPDPEVTLAGLGRHLSPHGVIGVSGWDPNGVLMVPDSMLDLLRERPVMPDMSVWTTGIAALGEPAGLDVVFTVDDELIIPFSSVAAAADQLERWSGGWGQLFEMFDQIGVGREARTRFGDHLASFSTTVGDGIGLRARYRVSVLRSA